jgi:hypothetical protein
MTDDELAEEHRRTREEASNTHYLLPARLSAALAKSRAPLPYALICFAFCLP